MGNATSSNTTTSAACMLCGSEDVYSFDRQPLVEWWRCRPCELFFVHPQPDAGTLDRLYRTRYYAQSVEESPGKRAKRERYWERRTERLEEATGVGRVLDVGCGKGPFLRAALARGWTPVGMEVDLTAISDLPGALRRRSVVGRLEAPPFLPGAFRAATLFDVIEHVRQPVRFLEDTARILEPGGTVMITTPNAGVFKARWRGRFWKYFRFDRYLHLYHFTPSSLERTLEAAGFTVTRWFDRGMPMIVTARCVPAD